MKQNEAIAVAIVVPLFFLLFMATQASMMLSTSAQNPFNITNSNSYRNTVSVIDTVVGEGEVSIPNTLVTVHYRGVLEDGTVFDSSYERGEPFQFILGAGQVIPGWEIGIQGMKVGGQRTLVVPPEFAYGEYGAGEIIPPNATLVFQVELLSIEEIAE